RRAACHRADHPSEAARRVSEERIPYQAWHARRRGAAAADEELHREGPGVLLRARHTMNYPDSVRYLYSLGNELKSAKFGLETISPLLEALGNPHCACRFVHVAGTNGKGSTCAMIESGLRATGIRTGLYTSPHLAEPTERIQIAGNPVTFEQFAGAFDVVHEA